MNITDKDPFKIGDWLIEPQLLQVSKNGETRKLEFRMMEILIFLANNPGEVVTRKRLHDEVWKEVYVTDNALTRTISKLRKILDDDPLEAKYIDTISKSGYRLVAPVTVAQDVSTDSYLHVVSKRKWLWGSAAVLILGVLIAMNISPRDIYTGFYDPTPISTLVGPELAHDIAPGGDKITFTYAAPGTNNPDVYVKLLDDLSQVNFTDLESPQGYGIWSPDGNYLAYASVEDGTCGIYIEPSIGGEKKRVGDCYSRPDDFVWSPDGKTIAFTDFKENQSRRIFFLDLATQTAQEVLTPNQNQSHRDPAFTSDGRYLVFRILTSGQGADIHKMNLKDKAITALTFDNSKVFGLDVFDDDKQLVYSSNKGGQWALWRMPIEGGTSSRLYINDRILLEPKFSDDSKRLIYKSVSDQTQLWAFDQDSSFKEPKQVAASTRTDIHPSLSPDGKKLVFLSNRSGKFEIWVAHLDGSHTTKMTSLEGSFINMPSWSPDGSSIVFDARTNRESGIYILDVATRMVRTFVNMEGDQVNARFTRDGKSIWYASNHTGSWQIWEKPLYDGKSSQVTKNGGFLLKEGYDDHLYFTRSDTSGLWRRDKLSDKGTELFLPALASMDWGSWEPTTNGIIFLDRTQGPQFFNKPYHPQDSATHLFTPAKRIQFSTPTITATPNGKLVYLAQIEKSEDELMMVEFE